MNRTIVAIIISLAAGFAAGTWTGRDAAPPEAAGESAIAGGFDESAPLGDRIAALERAVAWERDARVVLEEQLHGLYAEIERFDSPEMDELLRTLAESSQAREQARVQRVARGDRGERMQSRDELRVGQFVAGGFTEGRARQILELEDEIRMAALQAEFEARQKGESFNPWEWASGYQEDLREQLGDADYEKYLTAQGGQASVTVREVIGESPANRAGLQPGDRIVGYDGKRIFTMNELRSMAFSGEAGEDVIVDVERNGQRIQLVLPRGPMGITGSGGGAGIRSPFGG